MSTARRFPVALCIMYGPVVTIKALWVIDRLSRGGICALQHTVLSVCMCVRTCVRTHAHELSGGMPVCRLRVTAV